MRVIDRTIDPGKTHSFLQSDSGTTMPEYALLLLLAISAGLTGYQFLGRGTNQVFHNVDNALDGAVDERRTYVTPAEPQFYQPPAVLTDFPWHWLAATLALLNVFLFLRRRSTRRKGSPQLLEETAAVEPPSVFERRQRILRILSQNLATLVEGTLEVRHVMMQDPTTIQPSRSVTSALEIMTEENLNYLVVADKSGILQGLLSRHFLQKTGLKRVEEVMATEPTYVAESTLLNPTITQMMNRGVSCVVVVDDKQNIRGLLTALDVQLTLQCALQLLGNRSHRADIGELVS